MSKRPKVVSSPGRGGGEGAIGESGGGSSTISGRPHPNVIINSANSYKRSGKSNRPPLVFAIGEKVDNSISATKDNVRLRKIGIYFMYDDANELVAIVIRDNGKGMPTKNDFKAYVTVSWSQAERLKQCQETGVVLPTSLETSEEMDLHPRASVNSNIGEFGIGAKTSAFYMGMKELILSCGPKSGIRKSLEPVGEARLSATNMKKRWHAGMDPWEFDLTSRKLGDTTTLLEGSESHPAIKELIEKEEEYDFKQGDGFSMFIITEINQDVKEYMSMRGSGGTTEDEKYRAVMEERISRDLARTYHFYTHGKNGDLDLPDFSDDEDSGSDDDDAEGNSSVGKKRKASSKRAGPSSVSKKKPNKENPDEEKRCDIVVYAYKMNQQKYKASIADIRTVETNLLHPTKILRPNGENNQPLELTIKVRTKQGVETKLFCILQYCPFSLSGETRPSDKYEDALSKNDVVISTFWQGRWIPYGGEFTSRLKIFEDLRATGDKRIPEELFKRLRMTIFCQRSFPPDPVKLDFVENLDALINKDDTTYYTSWSISSSIQMTRLQKKIADFIDERHSRFDREIGVDGILPDKDENGKRLVRIADGKEVPITRFTIMKYGKDKNKDVTFKKNDNVTIKIHKRCTHYGIIEYFECDKLTGERNVTSKATVWYKRLPATLFGEEIVSCDVSQKLALATGDRDTEQHFENQIEKLMDQVPVRIMAYTITDRQATGEKYQESKFQGMLLSNLYKGPVPAGTRTPALTAYVLNKEGKVLTDVPLGDGTKRAPLKVGIFVEKTHDDAMIEKGNPDGKLKEGFSLSEWTQETDKPSEKGAFQFKEFDQTFCGAGKYLIEVRLFAASTGARGVQSRKFDVKKVSQVVKVVPGEPELADVTFPDIDILRLGVRSQSSFKVCLRDSFGDERYLTHKKYRSASGNLVMSFPKDTRLEAVDIEPEGLQVKVHGPELSKQKGYADYTVTVSPKEGHVFQELRKAHQETVEGMFWLRFFIPVGKGRTKEFTSPKEYTFRLAAGNPREIVFANKRQLEDQALRVENRSVLPKVDLRVLDKYGHFVTVGGDDSNVVDIEITESLTYKGANKMCAERQVDERKVQVTAGGTATLGRRQIHLTEPPVLEDEVHEWKFSAEADLKGGKTKQLRCATDHDPLPVTITPSTLPHSARPFLDGASDPEFVDSVYRVYGEAGTEVNGVFFKLYDEADREVENLSGWKVKWPKTTKEVALKDNVMPGYKCRKQAKDELELTVTFVGPPSKSEPGDKIAVDLVLVPYASAPHHWVLCDNKGKALPGISSIGCDEPLCSVFWIQLRDKFDNVIDLSKLNSQCKDPSEVIRPMFGFKWTGPGIPDLDRMGDDTFDDTSNTTMILPSQDMRVRATAGPWELEVRTNCTTKPMDGMKIEESAKHAVEIRAGPPKKMKITMTGIPHEQGADTVYTFPPDKKEKPDESLYLMSMPGLPANDAINISSTAEVKKIQVQLLDQIGNVIDPQRTKGVKGIMVSLNLQRGNVRLREAGKQSSGGISRKFGEKRSKEVSFDKVVLEAGTVESTDQIQGEDKLILSSEAPGLEALEVPLTFSFMNKVVDVVLLPNPYTQQFCVGDRLTKLIVQLKTQDGVGINRDFAKHVKVKCVQSPGIEEEGVFSEGATPQWQDQDSDIGNEFLIMPGRKKLMRTGPHTIVVTYKEERPSLIAVTGPYEKMSNQLTFNVIAGSPHLLEKRTTDVNSHLENCKAQARVSNSSGKDASERMIIKRPLILQIRDEQGNECIGCSDLCVVATIEQQKEFKVEPGDTKPPQMPDEPSYDVSYVAGFEFCNDAEMQVKLSEAKAKEDADLQNFRAVHSEYNTRNNNVKEKEAMVKVAQKKVDEKLEEAANYGINRGECNNVEGCNMMIQHLGQGGSIGQRPPRVPQNLERLAMLAKQEHGDHHVLGLLNDLIYVEDEAVAKIIGWISSNGLKTLIVDKKSIARDIDRDARFRDLEILTIEDSLRWRGQVAQNDKLVLHNNCQQQNRWLNDRAACNLVEFHNPSHHERLRQTVVFSLIGKYCVLDESYNNLTDKISQLRRNNVQFPDLISVPDGRKIKFNGVMGGRGSRVPTYFDAQRDICPGQKNMSGIQMNWLREMASRITDLTAKQNEHRLVKNKWDEDLPALRDELAAKRAAFEKSLAAHKDCEDERRRKAQGDWASEDGVANAGTLPELEFVRRGEAGGSESQNADVGPLGRFVFQVDRQGRVEIGNLGLREGVGNREGAYKLVCKLHKTSGEPVLRSEPGMNEVVPIAP